MQQSRSLARTLFVLAALGVVPASASATGVGSTIALAPVNALAPAVALAPMNALARAVALAPAIAAAPAMGDQAIAFDEMAKAFLAEHKLADAKPESLSLPKVLDGEGYVKLALGVFDVRYPVEQLKDKTRSDEFGDIVNALLQYQAKWLEWFATKHARYAEATADIATLQKWVKGWSASAFSGIERGDERDLMRILKPREPIARAAERFQKLMLSGEMLGLGLQGTQGAQILFAPDRAEFMGIASFLGWIDPKVRVTFWTSNLVSWTQVWHGVTQIVALEYPSWPINLNHPTRGVSMNEDEKTGMLEHVLQRASTSMFWHYFGTNDAVFFEQGNATNLVIAIYGQNNVRIGGAVSKNSGNTTQPYERFVPGGNPGGGVLPPNSAAEGDVKWVPLWRTTVGRDWFVKPLKKAQQDGAGVAVKERDKFKNKAAHFLLTADDNVAREFVTAPFLGKPAEGKRLPTKNFLNDYEDFFRAYTSCFYHWLQTQAVPKNEKASMEKYGALILKVATRGPSESFDDCVAEVYGLPLSMSDDEKESLEWRFLTWLSK